MAVPQFEHFMLPVLKRLHGGSQHSMRSLLSAVADDLGLSVVDRAETLPSGRSTKLYSRVQWSVTYMAQAALVKKIGRGVYEITPSGEELLAERPEQITSLFLRRYPEFLNFINRTSAVDDVEIIDKPSKPVDLNDPDTMLQQAALQLRDRVVIDLHERVQSANPRLLESLAVELLTRVGYGKGRVTGKSGDQGVDGIIEFDLLGLDRICVQCKRTEASVGGPSIRSFIGAIHQANASRGVFVTTADFTPEAKTAAKSAHGLSIALIDGRQFAELLYDHGVGVVQETIMTISRVDDGRFSAEDAL